MNKIKHIGAFVLLISLMQSCGNSDEVETLNSALDTVEIFQEEPIEIPNESAPDVIQLPADYLPDDYFIYDRIGGALNKDDNIDSVYIVKKIDPENIVVNDFDETVDRNRRGIMVFFKHAEGWELSVQNLACFSSENEDGGVYYPPQLSVNIEKGNLYLHYSHGRYGYWKYTFRSNKQDFELIGFDSSANHGPITDKVTSINYLTKRKLTSVNINADKGDAGDEVFEDTWTDIEIDALLLLSEIEDVDELVID